LLDPFPAVSFPFHFATPMRPPGEKHWHGATPTTAMTHIAIQELVDVPTAIDATS